jgi:hypothetical protein
MASGILLQFFCVEPNETKAKMSGKGKGKASNVTIEDVTEEELRASAVADDDFDVDNMVSFPDVKLKGVLVVVERSGIYDFVRQTKVTPRLCWVKHTIIHVVDLS